VLDGFLTLLAYDAGCLAICVNGAYPRRPSERCRVFRSRALVAVWAAVAEIFVLEERSAIR